LGLSLGRLLLDAELNIVGRLDIDPSRMQLRLSSPDEHGVKAFGIAGVNGEPVDLDDLGTDRGDARRPRPLDTDGLGKGSPTRT
jgi:hypothetical protein